MIGMYKVLVFLLILIPSFICAQTHYEGIYKLNGFVAARDFKNGIQYYLDPTDLLFTIEESETSNELYLIFLNPKNNAWQVFHGIREDTNAQLFSVYDQADYLSQFIELEISIHFSEENVGTLIYTIKPDPEKVLSSGNAEIVFGPIEFKKVTI